MAELIPDLKINKDDPESGIKDLLKIIKPTWESEKICRESLSGGYSSKIFKYFDGNNPDDAVTIRIQNFIETIPGIEQFRNQIEPKIIQQLSKTGHFPKVYAFFANGYCYEYIKGKPILNAHKKVGFMDDNMLHLIAKNMAYIHSLKVEGADYTKAPFMQNMSFMVSTGQFALKHEKLPSKEALVKELHTLHAFSEGLGSPIVTCHGDPHSGNFIWNPETKKVTFVDWEMAYIGYQHHEIAHFLVAIHIFDPILQSQTSDIVMPENLENKFLKFYFDEWCAIQKQEVTDEQFQKFKETVWKSKLGVLLFFVTISIIFPDIVTDFSGDSAKFFENNFKQYLKHKEEVLGKNKFEIDL